MLTRSGELFAFKSTSVSDPLLCKTSFNAGIFDVDDDVVVVILLLIF